MIDKKIPTVVLPNLSDGKEYIWGKTKEAFMYIHKNYCDYDYVLKVDDDTYVYILLYFQFCETITSYCLTH